MTSVATELGTALAAECGGEGIATGRDRLPAIRVVIRVCHLVLFLERSDI